MKLAKTAPVVLHTGDRAAVTVTHNIKINGEDSWVKYELESTLQEGELIEEMDKRLITHAVKTVVNVAEQAALEVMTYQSAQKRIQG